VPTAVKRFALTGWSSSNKVEIASVGITTLMKLYANCELEPPPEFEFTGVPTV
jgi:hypothetical protein